MDKIRIPVKWLAQIIENIQKKEEGRSTEPIVLRFESDGGNVLIATEVCGIKNNNAHEKYHSIDFEYNPGD